MPRYYFAQFTWKKNTQKNPKKQRRILGNNVSIYLIRLKRGSNLGYISEL